MQDTDNILAFLDDYFSNNPKDISAAIAADFRRRRIEKSITRKEMSRMSGVAESNITRFERTGLISLQNLIALALATGYTAEVKNIFSKPKYSTIEEYEQIKRNSRKTKAYSKRK